MNRSPPFPSSRFLSAAAVSGGEIDLAWTDTSTTVPFDILESTDGGTTWNWIGMTEAGASGFAVDGQFAPATTYGFEVQTLSDAPSAIAGPVSVTTPTTPANLQAVAGTGGVMNLTWTDSAGDAANFVLTRSDDGGQTWHQIALLPGTATSYTDTPPNAAAETYYQIAATNVIGSSAYVSTGLGYMAEISVSQSELNLDASSLAIPATASVDLQESTDGINWTSVRPTPTWTDDSFVAINETFASNTTYWFRLNESSSGYSAYSYVLPVTTPTFPTAPTNATATVVSNKEVDLSWSDTAGDEAGFTIYRRSNPGLPWSPIANISSQSTNAFADTTAIDGTVYYYAISAVNASGIDSAETFAAFVTTAIIAPQNVTCTASNLQITRVSEPLSIGDHRQLLNYIPNILPTSNEVGKFVQMGFIGAHADVGGGYGLSDGISNFTLHWMMNQAELTGWQFATQYSDLNGSYNVDQIHDSYHDLPSGYGYNNINRQFLDGFKVILPGMSLNSPGVSYSDLVHNRTILLYDPYFVTVKKMDLGHFKTAIVVQSWNGITSYLKSKIAPWFD